MMFVPVCGANMIMMIVVIYDAITHRLVAVTSSFFIFFVE